MHTAGQECGECTDTHQGKSMGKVHTCTWQDETMGNEDTHTAAG